MERSIDLFNHWYLRNKSILSTPEKYIKIFHCRPISAPSSGLSHNSNSKKRFMGIFTTKTILSETNKEISFL